MASASRLKFLFVYSRHASAIAFRSESLSFFTTLSFSAIAVRMLNLYEQYLALSKTHDVKLAGPFLVIKGGQPQTEQAGTKINNLAEGPVKKILIVEDHNDA